MFRERGERYKEEVNSKLIDTKQGDSKNGAEFRTTIVQYKASPQFLNQLYMDRLVMNELVQGRLNKYNDLTNLK